MAGKRNMTGHVQGANDNGINIDGTWYNFSKFFTGERQPAKGSGVTAVIGEFNGRDYLNSLTVVGGALQGTPDKGTGMPTYSGRSGDTDKRIARQVALKAAVEYCAGAEASEAEIVASARIFERFLGESYTDDVDIEDVA